MCHATLDSVFRMLCLLVPMTRTEANEKANVRARHSRRMLLERRRFSTAAFPYKWTSWELAEYVNGPLVDSFATTPDSIAPATILLLQNTSTRKQSLLCHTPVNLETYKSHLYSHPMSNMQRNFRFRTKPLGIERRNYLPNMLIFDIWQPGSEQDQIITFSKPTKEENPVVHPDHIPSFRSQSLKLYGGTISSGTPRLQTTTGHRTAIHLT